jgi:hypothetical protein
MRFPPIDEVFALLPAAIAGLVLVVAGAWRARRAGVAWLAGAVVLALGVAYAGTFVRERGMPAVPPKHSVERALLAVVAAAVVALVPAILGIGRAARLPFSAACGAGAVLLVAKGFPSPVLATVPLAAAAAFAAAYVILLDLATAAPAPAFCIAGAVAVGASGQAFFLFGSAFLGQLAGAVSILLVLVGLAPAWAFKERFPAAGVIPLAAIVVALGADAALFLYTPPPLGALVLMGAAPLGLLAAHPRWHGGRCGRGATLIGLATSLLLAGAGFAIAWRSAPPQ